MGARAALRHERASELKALVEPSQAEVLRILQVVAAALARRSRLSRGPPAMSITWMPGALPNETGMKPFMRRSTAVSFPSERAAWGTERRVTGPRNGSEIRRQVRTFSLASEQPRSQV